MLAFETLHFFSVQRVQKFLMDPRRVKEKFRGDDGEIPVNPDMKAGIVCSKTSRNQWLKDEGPKTSSLFFHEDDKIYDDDSMLMLMTTMMLW